MYRKIILATILIIQVAFLTAQSLDLNHSLPVDKEFIVGKLENGLTYYIRETNLSENRADFFIVHNVGSLQEDENQRGLAHFLEHMAFNGTKHFPGNSLIRYFESIGVKFGANVNAYTSRSRTVYNISEVPVTRSVVIDSTLLALHDWSHYIDCLPEEIEKERGVVREEMRLGDEPRSRMLQAVAKAQQAGSRFAVRAPIGLADVVENFERKDLLDFYHKWYRPNEQAVVVVGDIDAKDIEQRIIERFSAIPNPENEEEKLYYSVPDNSDPIIEFYIDPELKATSARMTVKIPYRPVAERQTYALLYDNLVDDLFLEMFNSRCVESVKKPDAYCRAIVPIFGEIDYACKILTATAIPSHGKNLYDAFKGVLEEVERIRQYRMTDLELDQAKHIVKAKLQRSQSDYNQKSKNSDIVSFAVDNFTRNQPLVNQIEYFEIALSMLDKINIDDINENIERVLGEKNRVIIFTASESDKESLPTTENILSYIQSVQNSDLEQYIPKAKLDLVLSEKIESCEILESRKITPQELGVEYKIPLDSTTELRLRNGARIIWKESYDSSENVRFSAFAPGGYARAHPIENITILNNYMRFFNVATLNRNELMGWTNSNGIRFSSKIDTRIDNFSGTFKPENCDSFFKLLYASFTDVTADETELRRFKQLYLETIGQEKSEMKLFEDSIKTLSYYNNPRKANIDTTMINGITCENLEKLYQSHFSNPSEYTFVFTGPMPFNDAKPLIEKYIATIPVDDKSKNKELVCKEPVLKKENVQLLFKAESTTTSKATISVVFHAPIEYNTENYVNNIFLTEILRKRYHSSIREDKGGTYHVSVTSSLDVYPSSQLVLNIDFDTRPSMISELLDIIQHEVDFLLKDGPTAQEIEEIKMYRLKKMEADKSTPWIDIISSSILGEQFIDANDHELINQVSVVSVHKLVKDFFTSAYKKSFVFDPKNTTVDL